MEGRKEGRRGWVPERGMVLRDFRARREMMNLARQGINGRVISRGSAVDCDEKASVYAQINKRDVIEIIRCRETRHGGDYVTA